MITAEEKLPDRENLRMAFGKIIKNRRIGNMLSLKEVSSAIGVPLGTLWAWEQGNNDCHFTHFIRLIKFLNIDLDEIIKASSR